MATSTTQSGDVTTDRQRAREQRGIRSTKAVGAADRLPSPPRQRRPALAALAVLLIVGGATIAAILALRADERVAVLMVERTIGAGERIEESDLSSTQVASEGMLLIPSSQLDQVVGRHALVRIQSGQLLDTSMTAQTSMLTEGNAAVGVSLPVGRYPASGLLSGDVVDVVAVDTEGGGEVVAEEVRVSSSTTGQSESGAVSGNGLTATLIVPLDVRGEIANLAATNSVAVVLIERGRPVDGEEG